MASTDPTASPPAALPSEKVKQAVNRWSAAGFFRVPNMGGRITVNQVVPQSSYTVRLWSEYEHRAVSRASKPYHGEPTDDRGTPPHPWDIPVHRPRDFEDRTEQTPVPHTEAVESCGSCLGMGIVNCGACQGMGQVNCSFCNGTGYRERTVTRTDTGPDGAPTTRTETVRDNCTCFGGKVNCPTCSGRGKVQCGPCAGTGRVKTYDLLTVKFSVAERCEVLNATDVPAHLLKGASGTVRVEENGERLEQFAPVAAEVDAKAQGLLLEAQADRPDTRLLFQRLHVEEVPVQEVRYWFGGPPLRRLWVYGDEAKVHAPDAPWAYGRLAMVLGGAAAVVAVVVVLALLLLH
ncbi:MAG TPA: hypothetical protein VJ739_17935 [Gemmataceae bacterium]|nr:hypothetical protein [Gemmataceae bacterium]